MLDMKATALVILLGSGVSGMAQQQLQNPDLEKQRIAMKRLSFLTGSWSGEAQIRSSSLFKIDKDGQWTLGPNISGSTIVSP